MLNYQIETKVRAAFVVPREIMTMTLVGHQIVLAGKFIESELQKYGSVQAIPNLDVIRALAPSFLKGIKNFPSAAQKAMSQESNAHSNLPLNELGAVVAKFNTSPVLIANIEPLQTLAPDNGSGTVNTSGGTEPNPTPVPLPEVVQDVTGSFDQLPQELRDQAQVEWDSQVRSDAQLVIEAAMADIQSGGGGDSVSIGNLSGQITAFAAGAASSIGGPLGVALASLALILIPRMLAQFEDWLVGYELEHGGI